MTSLSEAACGLSPIGLSGLPAVENIGEAEQPAHHARFGVLGRASEKIVVVEIEIDDLAVAIDRDARDVVAKIAVPIHAQSTGFAIMSPR